MSELKNFNQEKDLPTPMGKLEITLQTLINYNKTLDYHTETIKDQIMKINGFNYNIKEILPSPTDENDKGKISDDTLMDKFETQLYVYSNLLERLDIVARNLNQL